MTKSAIDQLTRTAALELAEYGIRVNAVKYAIIHFILFTNPLSLFFSLSVQVL